MKNFEFDGEKYKKFSTHQKEWGNKIIDGLEIGADFNILDLGCGDGVLTNNISHIAHRGKTIGIDASKGMIDIAKQIKGDNLEFRLMDINNLSFNEKFDVIFSNAALHWVKNHEKLLESCKCILNEGGQIRFNFAGDGNCRTFFRVVKEIINKKEYKEYFKNFDWPWYMPSVEEYKEVINKVGGYEEVEVYGEIADRFFNNETELIGWIDQPSIVPFLEYLPLELKSGFREEVIKEMVLLTKGADGRCFEEFKRINFIARKGE
ncbi:MAG: class I SAM-dependent methyltransferase [Clostridium sp.]